MSSENKDGIKPLLKKLFPRMILINIPVWLITLFWGFDLTMMVGLAVGTAYSVACCIYLWKSIMRAVECSQGKAKAVMMSCYLVRFLGMGVLGYFALSFNFMNFVGFMLPQFYPRIILTIMTFFEKKK